MNIKYLKYYKFTIRLKIIIIIKLRLRLRNKIFKKINFKSVYNFETKYI